MKDLVYWCNSLFALTIIYLLPLCVIAMMPVFYWFFITHRFMPGLAAALAVTGMAAAALLGGISLAFRKIIFITCVYLLSGGLLYYLGLHDFEFLYLLTACVFTILIFQTVSTSRLMWINFFICFSFAMVGLVNAFTRSAHRNHTLSVWMTVSSNFFLVGFFFVLAALILRLFIGLKETIHAEKQLKIELGKQQPFEPNDMGQPIKDGGLPTLTQQEVIEQGLTANDHRPS